jgi:hypothetical protein
MKTIKTILLNLIFCVQVLLTFLLFFGDEVSLPIWLQVAGRLHPVILHLPIGLWILFFAMVLLRDSKDLEHKTYETIAYSILLFTSFTASTTALLGVLLSVHGDYGADSLTRHKFIGVALSWLCYLILVTYDWQKNRKVIFYSINGLALLALIATGHTGATLTHGENFLFEPLATNQRPTLSLETSTVYELSVHRIFEKKCFSCHNDAKAKGGLVMTSIEQFVKGGKHGVKVIELPVTDDHHMPPDGKAQLTDEETQLIRSWIKSGADFEKKIADLNPDDSLRLVAVSMMANEIDNTNEHTYPFQPASERLVEKLNSPFMTLAPLSANSPALRADFYVSALFNIKTLEALTAVKEQLVELNLSHMPITDKDLSFIGNFKNLEKLNLNFTNISADLTPLKSLKNLRSLSLSGTRVNSQSLTPILSLSDLKELFVWNTSISNQDQLALNKKYSNISVVSKGSLDNNPTKLSKPTRINEDVLKENEPLMLKHPMPGVTIRYTLDGTDPDSINGENFTNPIHISGSTTLKDYAFKEGWLKSDIYEATCFVAGSKPIAMNLLTNPEPQYMGEGVKTLIDGVKGNADQYRDASWLGYRNNPFVAEFDFQNLSPSFKNITISYGRNIDAYLFPPAEVEVWGGSSKQKISLIKKISVPQPVSSESVKVEALIIPLENTKCNYYKVVCKPVDKLPKWHRGKGEKGWFFIDEIFFN